MRMLITWGSKLGGTAGIAEMLGAAMREAGLDVVIAPAARAPSPQGFDGVVVGGALYANRWHADARRYVERHELLLRKTPTWLFSSGPLDDSADHEAIAPPRQLRALMERIGALDHVTFGGRLDPAVKGFPAQAMAKDHAGDWRNPARIRAWGAELARALPGARPAPVITHPGHAVSRLLAYGVVGWAVSAVVLAGILATGADRAAVVVHAITAPLVFGILAFRYQAPIGARAPLTAALAWTGLVAVLHLAIVAGALQRSLALVTSPAGYWLPLALIFVVAWGAGAIGAMLPMPKTARRARGPTPLAPTPG